MDCLIISGMSGAGKSLTVDVLEDIGFYCVDNMPAALIPRFIELFQGSSAKYKRVAFVVDVRGDIDFELLFRAVDEMRTTGTQCRVLFLDATDEVLINRQKESRRRHPLDKFGKGLTLALSEERQMLEPIKERANYLIDTSVLASGGLRAHLMNLFAEEGAQKQMIISMTTFGFKYGIPHESDMVFDVRFLKNPYYVPALRELCGLDAPVRDYVMAMPQAKQFAEKLTDLLDFLIPLFIREGKTSLVVAIGCTGGRHRSVAICEETAQTLELRGHQVSIRHRDLRKG